MNPNHQPILSEQPQDDWFKQESLAALRRSLANGAYPGYPLHRLALSDTEFMEPGRLCLRFGPWHTGDESSVPSTDEYLQLAQQGYRFDAYGRPLHPWIKEMVTDPDIGAITGKGFYWNWGPNYTADPIIVRHDLSEPHVLLIKRRDTKYWALPGGFINNGEPETEAAMREGREESGVDINELPHTVTPIYKGPLADLRATANAWPETTAIRFDLILDNDADIKKLEQMMTNNIWQTWIRHIGRVTLEEQISRLPWKGGDDALKAKWIPLSKIHNQLFGSHQLLIQMAVSST